MEKTKQYYIDEFYKFLESKEKGLSAYFDVLYDNDEFSSVEEMMQNKDNSDFIRCAICLTNDSYWTNINFEWSEYLKTLKHE